MTDWVRLFVLFLAAAVLAACGSSSEDPPLFSFLPPDSTGITFANVVDDQPDRNVLTYEYLYNGGGVAAGDVNGDGRPDLYFTANMGPNALYLNRGDFQFEEVTAEAGVVDTTGWTTGVTMADVNGDGRLDIYVCKSGPLDAPDRANKLYINQGDGTFAERAAQYGLADPAYSTHATFFDYDRDGDLDLYLLNNPPVRDARVNSQPTAQQRNRLPKDRLYENRSDSTGTRFVNVSEEAGLNTNVIGYGLSATVGDVNRDGWPDIYVANDYLTKDRLYINQGDGTFENEIMDWVDHMSRSSMGSDIADYDNDGRPDVFVADMLAEDNRRQKLLGLGQRRTYQKNYQFVRNVLQINNGTGGFSEIGRLAGVSNTDWSWATLLADYDLDGRKDLYVTNGIRHDYTNLDFQYTDYLPTLRTGPDGEVQEDEIYKLVEKMPSTRLPNYIFRNQGDLTFEKKSTEWGVGQKGFSNGAAYADLDTDGDLDLVVNNIDEEAWVYRNTAAERTDHNHLRVELRGEGDNTHGVGAEVTLTTPTGRTLYQQLIPSRGFQSSVEQALTFGLGAADSVDLTVTWPDQTRQRLPDVRANQTLVLDQADATERAPAPAPEPERRIRARTPEQTGLAFVHRENPYEDYMHESLLPHSLARLGPALAKGDVTGDGRPDVFVGGAKGQASALYVQRPGGTFDSVAVPALAADANYEDVAATVFDANGDGHQDLYVVSGGRSEVKSEHYRDRLYLGDGTGGLEPAPEDALPPVQSSGGTVAAHDYDGDGDQDLFVGGRVDAVEYPVAPRSYLLENEGGTFTDVTEEQAPALVEPGLVADARWRDVTGDAAKELILAGEWMPIRVFERTGDGTFAERTEQLGLDGASGWWNRIRLADLDGDGDLDIVAGNRGENAQVTASPEEPASVYVADFNGDGQIEPIMSYYNDGTEYPTARRMRLTNEWSLLRARFQTYEAYAEATMDDLLTERHRERAERMVAHTFTTSLFEQTDDGTFIRHDLPTEAQFSPTHGIVVRDVNDDGRPDVLLAGNDFTVRKPWGPSDAGKGLLLRNRGDLAFEAQRPYESGFYAPGDVRNLLPVSADGRPLVVVGNNDDVLDLFELRPPAENAPPRRTE